MRKKYLIIGNSAAGIAAIRTLRQVDAQAEIVVVSDESEQAYNKCFLADYIAQNKTIDQVYTLQERQLVALDVTMKLGKKAIFIDAQASVVRYHDNTNESYDAGRLHEYITQRYYKIFLQKRNFSLCRKEELITLR